MSTLIEEASGHLSAAIQNEQLVSELFSRPYSNDRAERTSKLSHEARMGVQIAKAKATIAQAEAIERVAAILEAAHALKLRELGYGDRPLTTSGDAL